MAAVGCQGDAQKAVDGLLERIDQDMGWHRRVYVDRPKRFVYKVARHQFRWQNLKEHEIASEARRAKLPGIPETRIWMVGDEPVLAMPYFNQPFVGPLASIVHDLMSNPRDYRSLPQEWERFGDLHQLNWRMTEAGQPVLIDLAGFSAS
jgi:hypothetical protein